MKSKEMFEIIQKKFFERIEKKTGWGKNEIKAEFNTAATEAAFEILEKNTESKKV